MLNPGFALAFHGRALQLVNGVALIVFYDNGNSGDDRNVVLWNGNDSNCLAGGVPENWDETINGVPYQGGSASLDFVVADGQSFTDGAVLVNGSTLVAGGQVFDGDTGPNYGGNPSGVTGSLWDVESFDLTSFLTTGSNNLHITSSAAGDCLSLVVAAANVPASAPVILSPAAPAHAAPAQRRESAPLPAASGRGGGVAVR